MQWTDSSAHCLCDSVVSETDEIEFNCISKTNEYFTIFADAALVNYRYNCKVTGMVSPVLPAWSRISVNDVYTMYGCGAVRRDYVCASRDTYLSGGRPASTPLACLSRLQKKIDEKGYGCRCVCGAERVAK